MPATQAQRDLQDQPPTHRLENLTPRSNGPTGSPKKTTVQREPNCRKRKPQNPGLAGETDLKQRCSIGKAPIPCFASKIGLKQPLLYRKGAKSPVVGEIDLKQPLLCVYSTLVLSTMRRPRLLLILGANCVYKVQTAMLVCTVNQSERIVFVDGSLRPPSQILVFCVYGMPTVAILVNVA